MTKYNFPHARNHFVKFQSADKGKLMNLLFSCGISCSDSCSNQNLTIPNSKESTCNKLSSHTCSDQLCGS